MIALPAPIKDHSVYGSEWGIYADEDITPNVLIGEYASDLLHGFDLILTRKPDYITHYSGSGGPKNIYLAPRDYCGMVPLVNGGKGIACNCSVWRIIFGGCLRVILVTNRKIKKGEELIYNYGLEFPF